MAFGRVFTFYNTLGQGSERTPRVVKEGKSERNVAVGNGFGMTEAIWLNFIWLKKVSLTRLSSVPLAPMCVKSMLVDRTSGKTKCWSLPGETWSVSLIRLTPSRDALSHLWLYSLPELTCLQCDSPCHDLKLVLVPFAIGTFWWILSKIGNTVSF